MKTSSIAQCYSIAGVFMPDGRAYCPKCAPESEDREPIYYADGTDKPIVCWGCGELLGVDLTTAGLEYVRSELLSGSVESITAAQWMESYSRDIGIEWATLHWLAYKRILRARMAGSPDVTGADAWRAYQVWADHMRDCYGHRYRDCEGSVSHKGMQSAMDVFGVGTLPEIDAEVDADICPSCPNRDMTPYCADPAACPYRDEDGQELARIEAAARDADDDDPMLDGYPSGTVDDSERYPAAGPWAGEDPAPEPDAMDAGATPAPDAIADLPTSEPARITYQTKSLKQALARVKPFVASGARAIPVLTCVMLYPSAVVATDCDVWAEADVDGQGYGRVLLPHKTLAAAVKACKAPTITVESLEYNRARVDSATIAGLDPAEFPMRPEFVEQTAFTADDIMPALAVVLPAYSRDETRPTLCGVHVKTETDGATKLIATDSYRLHGADFRPYVEGIGLTDGVTLPGSMLAAVAKSKPAYVVVMLGRENNGEPLDGHPEDVHTRYLIDTGSLILTGRTVEGQYPNYQQLVPVDLPRALTLDRVAMAESARAAAKVLGRAIAPLRISYNGNAHVDVSMIHADAEYSATLECAGDDGEPLEIGVNPDLIADAFDVMSGRTVTLHAITPLRPMLLSEPGRFALVMPIRLND